MPFGQLMAEFSNSPTGGGWIHRFENALPGLLSLYNQYKYATPEKQNWQKDFLNAEFSSVSFSHDGRRLAWVGHDSSIAVADAGMAVSCLVMNDSFVEFYVVEILLVHLVLIGFFWW